MRTDGGMFVFTLFFAGLAVLTLLGQGHRVLRSPRAKAWLPEPLFYLLLVGATLAAALWGPVPELSAVAVTFASVVVVGKAAARLIWGLGKTLFTRESASPWPTISRAFGNVMMWFVVTGIFFSSPNAANLVEGEAPTAESAMTASQTTESPRESVAVTQSTPDTRTDTRPEAVSPPSPRVPDPRPTTDAPTSPTPALGEPRSTDGGSTPSTVREVTFTIESEPVAADIYVRSATSAYRLVGRGRATVSWPVGSWLYYSIRPAPGSGYEQFDGGVVVANAATHPVWLTPSPAAKRPDPSGYPFDSPERRVVEWFAAYAREDWDAMTDMRLPSQRDREIAYNWIEGTYFFRVFQRLISVEVLSQNDVSARVRATWEHDMGRSYVDLMLIREDSRGSPSASVPWSVSYTSATGVRDLD